MDTAAQPPGSVWLVEDHSPLRQTLHETLSAANVGDVRAFASCEAALKAFDDDAARPQIIILDIGLPGMSGIEGLRQFKQRAPACDIIMFTIFDDRDRVFEAVCAGASGYLLKSESLDRIVEAIGEVSRGGAPMSPEIARSVLDRLSQMAPRASDVTLSDRERDVLRLLADGLIKKEIASRLDLSLHTVDNYVRRIYTKLHVNTIGGAVARALREGMM